MLRVDLSTIIEAPVGKVWGFMADLGTMPQRDPGVTKVDWQPPARVGTVAIITFRQVGQRTARYEIKEWNPMQSFRVHANALGSELDGVYRFEEVEGGKTRLTATVQIEVKGLLRLISPYISRKAKTDGKAELNRIKVALEVMTHAR